MLLVPLEEAVEVDVAVLTEEVVEEVVEVSWEVDVSGAEEEVRVVVEAFWAVAEEEDTALVEDATADDSETRVVVEEPAEEVPVAVGVTVWPLESTMTVS